MEGFLNKGIEILTTAGSKIILALLVLIIGRIIIGKIVNLLEKGKNFKKLDPTVSAFTVNFVKYALYIILVIAIISVLGVPMASVITVLASAGVAVGLALQGALSNLAGGIMILIFRPFNVGDFIIAAGEQGVVSDISMMYTKLLTTDNKKVTIPNGSLMGANVSNCSSEPTRRVDLTFSCAKGEDIQKIRSIMIEVMNSNPLVLSDPEPFARLSGGTNESMEFTTRAWTESANYWEVYFGLINDITTALGAAGIKAPATRVITEQAK